jgi:hypothetical protein
MPTIRSPDDYERCLIQILERCGGRASRGTVVREFERRYYSSVPRDLQAGTPPGWQRALEEARLRLVKRGRVFGDADLWELP